ncbi:hypothetical protein ACJZ2D_003323 [Fusarium nematophilum]
MLDGIFGDPFGFGWLTASQSIRPSPSLDELEIRLKLGRAQNALALSVPRQGIHHPFVERTKDRDSASQVGWPRLQSSRSSSLTSSSFHNQESNLPIRSAKQKINPISDARQTSNAAFDSKGRDAANPELRDHIPVLLHVRFDATRPPLDGGPAGLPRRDRKAKPAAPANTTAAAVMLHKWIQYWTSRSIRGRAGYAPAPVAGHVGTCWTGGTLLDTRELADRAFGRATDKGRAEAGEEMCAGAGCLESGYRYLVVG